MNPQSKNKISFLLYGYFFLTALFYPMQYVSFDSPYYTEFTFTGLFAGLLILWTVLAYHRPIRLTDPSDRWFCCWILVLLVLYNLFSLYINFTHSRWLWEQFNVSLAVLFFMVLLIRGSAFFQKEPMTVSVLLVLQVVTTILGIIVYYLGYTSVSFINGMVIPVAKDPNYYETRFSWIYYHKSQYCFVLLLFIAFSVIYRKHFKNKWFFPVSNLFFLFGIVISHTYTALFAAVLIYAGLALDYIRPKLRTINKKYFLLMIPPVLLLAFVVWRMSRERNIWSLGSRTYIWSEGIRQILKNPLGIGTEFGSAKFSVPGISFQVYNCHNVFLNEMWRFSLPVGLLFTLIFISILIYSLKKKFSFLNIGIWIAFLISLGMDYSLLGREFTLTFFYFYMIFFFPAARKRISG